MSAASICGLHHLQIAIAPGSEDASRRFYRDVLGLSEVAVPASVAHLAAAWFERGGLRVHLGVDANFYPSKKGHPAFLVTGLDVIVQRLAEAGFPIAQADVVPGFRRCHVFDPSGNRIELIEATSDSEKRANKAPEPTTMAVTIRAPSSTARASHGRGSS